MFFFFNDTATTEIYTLSLHDALPIYYSCGIAAGNVGWRAFGLPPANQAARGRRANRIGHAQKRDRAGKDRKSTRLNSSHLVISYAVFCLEKNRRVNQ